MIVERGPMVSMFGAVMGATTTKPSTAAPRALEADRARPAVSARVFTAYLMVMIPFFLFFSTS